MWDSVVRVTKKINNELTYGTGFLIDNPFQEKDNELPFLVMTNRHVFQEAVDERNFTVDFFYG